MRKTSNLTFEDLEKLQAEAKPLLKKLPMLPLAAIEVAPNVFQHRLPDENIQGDKDLMRDLVGAITLADEPSPLDPILVLNLGDRFFVVDGHHRLDAYHTAGWADAVPIELFNGDLIGAVDAALETNKKNKLPLGDASKLEAAWKRLVRGQSDLKWKLTQAKLSELTTVSLATVKRMAKRLKTLSGDATTMTWAQARKARQTGFEADHDWKDKKAAKLAEQLAKCDNLTKDPEITAMALAKISDLLPAMLVREWAGIARDVTNEMQEEFEEAAQEL